MDQFLASTTYINWQHPAVLAQALQLAAGKSSAQDIAQACFEFVRDQIHHSWDYRQNPVTCIASDVLAHGTGYCYAKSHLLAALLRANGIPAGLCYQRLTIGSEPPFCLHGLNAVYLPEHGWYRIDARGNKPGVQAEFCPPHEQLAFAMTTPGEQDFAGIWAEPHAVVLAALMTQPTVEAVMENLPDGDLSAELTPAMVPHLSA
ncbi:transglutaminase family protein [Undibacterium sp. TS12]|uniref:transglutaminase-like domain-containing protein n=1 Tax=Undibacterium sp. TS12 TaxID=2908202 RepID=UPI001F4D17C0|nr:transglutaminase family protein [Undibacterium sp. TS12]MCH8620339.1 transglutaminase family protein [Undibacterium sp. TS12]